MLKLSSWNWRLEWHMAPIGLSSYVCKDKKEDPSPNSWKNTRQHSLKPIPINLPLQKMLGTHATSLPKMYTRHLLHMKPAPPAQLREGSYVICVQLAGHSLAGHKHAWDSTLPGLVSWHVLPIKGHFVTHFWFVLCNCVLLVLLFCLLMPLKKTTIE